jgi:hypothetical protein
MKKKESKTGNSSRPHSSEICVPVPALYMNCTSEPRVTAYYEAGCVLYVTVYFVILKRLKYFKRKA